MRFEAKRSIRPCVGDQHGYQLIAVTMAININNHMATDNVRNKKKIIQIVKIINYVSIRLTLANIIFF